MIYKKNNLNFFIRVIIIRTVKLVGILDITINYNKIIKNNKIQYNLTFLLG